MPLTEVKLQQLHFKVLSQISAFLPAKGDKIL